MHTGFVFLRVVLIPTHAATSIYASIPKVACLTFRKDSEECSATSPPFHSVAHRQATLDTASEVIV